MAQMESMDVDPISNDFDDKENSLQNSNVLPRTPLTEKGYEELDVSELNMKLRYSMTPASSPMSRSFTANCRDNKMCDNGNNLINTTYNDNLNLSHSFNSTITDSILKSSKCPLQVLSTEQCVDNNGNPISRLLDSECNNVTIVVNETENIDDNLSLPSTSSSLVHTPEATTPTKDIVKDGGSPIMRGLKSVLNMFRSSQSPIPTDDIIANDLATFESQKQEEELKFATNLVSTPTTANKSKENISKTHSPLKDSLVFNEDLEKELLWKDEITILFKEEKIPVHKLFFPSNSESLNSKPIEKENMNTTVEYMDVSLNETVVADKHMNEKSSLEHDTLNSPESDSEFVDCETSYTKNDTRILDHNVLSSNINNMSQVLSTTDANTFQSNEIVDEENCLSVAACSDSANDTNAIISNIDDVIKEADIGGNCNQTIHNDLQFTLSDSLKEDISSSSDIGFIGLVDKNNAIVYENVNESVNNNRTFNLEKNSVTKDSQTGKAHNVTYNTSDIGYNDGSLCEEGKEDFKGFYQSPIINKIERSKELTCDFDSTIVVNEQTLKNDMDTFKIKNKTLPLESEVVNEVEMNLGVAEGQKITMLKVTEMPLVECEKVLNIDNKCNVKLDSEVTDNTLINQRHENKTDTCVLPDPKLETKDIKSFDNNLPSNIPLPYDSDIDKENLQDINEENIRETNLSANNTFNSLDLSTVSNKQAFDGNKSLNEKHSETILYPAINNIVPNSSIIETFQMESPEDISSDMKNDMSVNKSDSQKSEINNIEVKPTLIDNTIEFSSTIIDGVILPSNNNCSVSETDLNAIKHPIQNVENFKSPDYEEFVQSSNPTDNENKIDSVIDLKKQNNEESHLSTNNKSLVTEMELDFCAHDLDDKQTLLATTKSFTEKVTVENRLLEFTDDKTNISNTLDVRVKYDELDVPKANISTAAIDLDVSMQESEIIVNPNKLTNILSTLLEIPDGSSVEGIVQTNCIESVATIADKNEIIIETDVKINEEVNPLLTWNNSLVAEMELDVSKPDLEHADTEKQLKAPADEHESERLIENVNAKKYFENNNDNKEITSETYLKINEVVSIPSNSELVTEMELDISNNFEISSEKPSCSDTDIENCETAKNQFKTVPGVASNGVEMTCKDDFSLKNKLVVPLNKDISTDIDLVASKYENFEKPFETQALISTSPPISSSFTQNGYSINFDEIDDPFKTKTNVRMNSNSNINIDDLSNTKNSYIKNDFQRKPQPSRRKTLQDLKEPHVAKNAPNVSFDCDYKDNKNANKSEENSNIRELYMKDSESHDCDQKNLYEDAEIITSNKISSSPSDMMKSKNVFNIPEIDDINFNPFSTKSRIRQSPTEEIENISFDNYNIKDNLGSSPDVCYKPLKQTITDSAGTEPERKTESEPNLSPNMSNVTSSSKNTDDITSVREVNTEDEDTVEGPFLEAEDFADIVKVVDFGTKKDMMNFENLPTPANDDNENGEFFIDAEAFEFLLNQNKSNVVADSGKESLFLKFDPLFAKRVSSDSVLSALNKIQKRQSTPKKLTPLKVMDEECNTPGPSTTMPIGETTPGANDIVEEPVAAMSKPMMVVNPAIASIATSRKSTTPPRTNRRSLTFTSPAMAVIDRLLSLSGNSSTLDQDSSLPQNREYNETDFALTQLRELLAEKEIHVHNLRSESKELKERLGLLESQVRSLETEGQERLCKIKELNENLTEKNKVNKSMAIVVEEYERTIASLIAEMEQEKKQNAEERMRLISERDEQTAHLASMEVSFSDLHSKYEKSKQIILSMKANEDTYKKSLNEFEVNLLKMQTNYDLLKQHATSKLNHANQELEKYNRAHDAEVLKLNAMIKRKELHITSLEESLSQKTKANEELTAICDELINKVA